MSLKVRNEFSKCSGKKGGKSTMYVKRKVKFCYNMNVKNGVKRGV